MSKICIAIPCYNEGVFIVKTVLVVDEFMKGLNIDYEIVVADDASSDDTEEKGMYLASNYNHIRYVSNDFTSPHMNGKGVAVSRAWLSSDADVFMFIDADLAIDLRIVKEALFYLGEGWDVVVGSKHLPQSDVVYPKLRRVLSKCYSILSKNLLGSNVRDHQCGFKAFKSGVALSLIPFVESSGWSWDVEILIKAQWVGFRVLEVPARVKDVYDRGSSFNVFGGTWTMGVYLFKILLGKRDFLRKWKKLSV